VTETVHVARKEGCRFGMNSATMSARWWDGCQRRLITLRTTASRCIVGVRAAGLRRAQMRLMR